MRSLSSKLLLAFIIISLAGTGLFFGFARYNSNREIRDFLVDQDRSRILENLTAYYAANGSWEGLEPGWIDRQFTPTEQGRPGTFSPFILVNADKEILHGRGGWSGEWQSGEVVPDADLEDALQITLDGDIIGWLLIANPEPGEISNQNPIVKRMDYLLLFSAIGSLILAIILGLLLSRNLSRPLQQLSTAAQKAATGDLSQKVEVNTKDEIGLLAESFNQMMTDLEILIASRKQMTADIAHELRNPISVILGHAEGVYEGIMEPSLENFEIIRDEALHLERLVNDLRILSQADVGELPLEMNLTDPGQLLAEVIKTAKPALQEKEIELETNIEPDLPETYIDKDRILQVTRNILDNAVRHSPGGGKISLYVHNKGNQVIQISIQDSGPGIEEQEISKIFNRFYQIDSARTRDQHGSGLGLAIAKSIIQQHGGEIWAESPPGEGVKVIFTLPPGDSTKN